MFMERNNEVQRPVIDKNVKCLDCVEGLEGWQWAREVNASSIFHRMKTEILNFCLSPQSSEKPSPLVCY